MAFRFKMALTGCAQTQRMEGMLLVTASPGSPLGPRRKQGPASHLQSKCVVHRAGVGRAAGPSPGQGHLQIHGRLKQETAIQSGCYAADEAGSRPSLCSRVNCMGHFWLQNMMRNSLSKTFTAKVDTLPWRKVFMPLELFHFLSR